LQPECRNRRGVSPRYRRKSGTPSNLDRKKWNLYDGGRRKKRESRKRRAAVEREVADEGEEEVGRGGYRTADVDEEEEEDPAKEAQVKVGG